MGTGRNGIDLKGGGGGKRATKITVATVATQGHGTQPWTPTTAKLHPTQDQLDTWAFPTIHPSQDHHRHHPGPIR